MNTIQNLMEKIRSCSLIESEERTYRTFTGEKATELILSFSAPAFLHSHASTTPEVTQGHAISMTAPEVMQDLCVSRDGIYVRIFAGKGTGKLRVPLLIREFKHFYPDPENYEYLPAEDAAWHKSVTRGVDRAHKMKATPKNCYVRKSGVFLPLPEPPRAQRGDHDGREDEANPSPVQVGEAPYDPAQSNHITEAPASLYLPASLPRLKAAYNARQSFIEASEEIKKDMEPYLLHVLACLLSTRF